MQNENSFYIIGLMSSCGHTGQAAWLRKRGDRKNNIENIPRNKGLRLQEISDRKGGFYYG
ncbi:MAG: hypothetical protein HFH05_04915 [Lachnospiraceae bacterium]|jgi:hypothetical protein|nr:hypothetical protein [Lachnospiraceae bacterium]